VLLLFLSYFLVGAIAGTLSGLLGIGGGIIIVPALVFIFHQQHFSSIYIVHMAAGTSLAIIVLTSFQSLMAHLHRSISFWMIYRPFVPGVIVGTLGGAVLAYFLHSHTLEFIYAIVVLLMAVKMFFYKVSTELSDQLPGRIGCSFAGAVIGGTSGLLGLGGGAFTIPFLTHCRVSMRQTVVVACAFGATISIVGALSFAVTGMFAKGLPAWTTGYIYWPAWFSVVLGSLIFVRIGASLSHRMPTAILRRVFAFFLLNVGFHMLYLIR